MGSSETVHDKGGAALGTAKFLARRLKEWRTEAGLPLKHVARDLGVSVSIVCEWEHAHRFPSISHLEGIAHCMGLPVCCVLYHGPGHCPHSQSNTKERAKVRCRSAKNKR